MITQHRSMILGFLIFFFSPTALSFPAETAVPGTVMAVFQKNCMRCHGERVTFEDLNLSSSGNVLATAVGRPSREKPLFLRINPGKPDSSYLMMKVTGAPGIEGARMPLSSDMLSANDIQTISAWIGTLVPGYIPDVKPSNPVYAFPGWTVGNVPTAETLRRGQFLFLTAERFVPRVGEGFDELYGFSGPTVMWVSLGGAVTDRLLVNLGITNARNVAEAYARFRPIRQRERGYPLSLALQWTVDWETLSVPGRDRLRGAALTHTLQAIATRQCFHRFSLDVAPGITFNPNTLIRDEDPMVTIGLGGRLLIGRGFSLISEYIPVVHGRPHNPAPFDRYRPDNAFNTFSAGVEQVYGGHVFQVIATNSQGIAAGHFLSGGDIDFWNSGMRIGVNVYRVLGY